MHFLLCATHVSFDHMEVIIRIALVSQRLRKEFKSGDLVDGVLEILDSACYVEHDDQFGVYLIRGFLGEAHTLGIKGGLDFLELRGKPLSLADRTWPVKTWHISTILPRPIPDDGWAERQERSLCCAHLC